MDKYPFILWIISKSEAHVQSEFLFQIPYQMPLVFLVWVFLRCQPCEVWSSEHCHLSSLPFCFGNSCVPTLCVPFRSASILMALHNILLPQTVKWQHCKRGSNHFSLSLVACCPMCLKCLPLYMLTVLSTGCCCLNILFFKKNHWQNNSCLDLVKFHIWLRKWTVRSWPFLLSKPRKVDGSPVLAGNSVHGSLLVREVNLVLIGQRSGTATLSGVSDISFPLGDLTNIHLRSKWDEMAE